MGIDAPVALILFVLLMVYNILIISLYVFNIAPALYKFK